MNVSAFQKPFYYYILLLLLLLVLLLFLQQLARATVPALFPIVSHATRKTAVDVSSSPWIRPTCLEHDLANGRAALRDLKECVFGQVFRQRPISWISLKKHPGKNLELGSPCPL